MGQRRVTVTEYTCDGCGSITLGTITDDVFGIIGKATEHRPDGGHGADWFACRRSCVGQAVAKALDIALDDRA